MAVMPDQPDTSGIVLDRAGVTLEGRVVLSDLTFALTEPRIGIVGRNGSGKTTLLRLMAGLVAPTTGRVRVGDLDPARDRNSILSRLGILFQNPDHQILFPTVDEELAFGLRQMGLDEAAASARVTQLLAAEGRGHWASAATHTLSYGQRQYLCLQAILLMGPETLLLDEPFAGLDLPMQARLGRRLEALPQRVILISHDPAGVTHCGRVLWLDDGRVRADGPAEAVLPQFRAEMDRQGALDADADLGD